MRPVGAVLAALIAAAVVWSGCQKAPKDAETPTSGTLRVIVDESVLSVVRQEAEEFVRLYTKAAITCDSASSRDALASFASRAVKMVVLSRGLTQEEQQSLKAAGFEFSHFDLFKLGIAVIVNPGNPLKQLNLDQLRSIYTGRVTTWEEVGGVGGRITPITLSRNSGSTEVFLEALGISDSVSPKLEVVPASAGLPEVIAADPSAIGFVGMNWLSDKVKALELAADSSNDFVAINQASVYQGTYPLVQTAFALMTSGAYSLPSGFISFMTSAPGQKMFLNAGLVPVTMPVKLIRID